MDGPRTVRLAGWGRTVAGATIDYQSAHPDARRALVCRARGGPLAVAWRTAPVPADFGRRPAGEAVFLWLAGLAVGKGAHRFTLSVNGRRALAFRTDGRRDWTVAGPDGEALSFATGLVDAFGELSGVMALTLPAGRLRPGEPLDLRLQGEDAGSEDWCLVFEHALADRVRAAAEPALLRGPQGPRQPLRVEVTRLGPPAAVAVEAAGASLAATVREGYNELRLPVPPVTAPARTRVTVRFADGSPGADLEVARRPVRRRTLWLLPHPHLDIGYTDHQDEVERRHRAHLDQALALAEATCGHPPEARFRWNVEQLWAVESWWRRADRRRRRDLVRAVREGSIGLQALLAGVLTGLCHPEELDHLTDVARELAAAVGVPIDTAMITDIPGQTWTLVPALARAGVRYLSSGPNTMPGLPDGGDRIGGMLRAWGDRPVWWESADGRQRVLLWVAGRGYSWFHGLGGARLDPDRPRAVMDYLAELEEAGYRYDPVQVRYTIGGDNGPPDPDLPDRVRAWNEAYASPSLVIATADVMFRELERRHGGELPVVRGDCTPYWEDGAASSARETALNRASAHRLVQARALWAAHRPRGRPEAEFRAAWRLVVLFSEHTWGAAESVSDPDSPRVLAQWEYKRDLALAADRASRALLARGLAAARRGVARSRISVHNTLDRARGGVVRIAARGDRVLTAGGEPVASQRLADGRLAFLAAPVPARGAAFYRQAAGEPAAPPAGAAAWAEGLVLANEHLRATVDPVSGAIASLVWLPGGVELVDRSVWPGLNAYLYVPGRDPRRAVGPGPVQVAVGEPGPLTASLVVVSPAPGARSLRREYRLEAGSDRLRIDDLIDKLPVRAKESVHLAFPFLVPGARVRVDLGGTLIRPDADQLAGACRDWYCVHDGVEVAGEAVAVHWIAHDAPLVELGALTDETPGPGGVRTWRPRADADGTLFSYAMNNHWHTNYRAEQEGPVRLRYTVRPHAPGSGDLGALGRECQQPLLAAPAARPHRT